MKQYNRLVLGTAQIGMPYGIANTSGQPDLCRAENIIQTAWENGIQEYDTAQAYGDSEKVLGEVFRSLGIHQQVRVISKIHPGIDHRDPNAISSAVYEILKRLDVPRLYCLMIHREEFLDLWNVGLYNTLKQLARDGLADHIGISVYSPEKAIQALNMAGIEFVQIPSNILDQRFEKAGVFDLAREKKKQIFIRSIFLQGLLLMKSDNLPEKMAFSRTVIRQFEQIVNDSGLSPQEIALGYIRERFPDARIIFGAETPQQVRDNMVWWNTRIDKNIILQIEEKFDRVEERILNPALWNQR